jgi:Ca2+-binding RTX toxin-like protein
MGGTFRGDSGSNVLVGTVSRDQFFPGAGSDTLTGGMGADRFVYASASDGRDTITDFAAAAGGDILDIHSVLTGFGTGTSNPSDFVRLTENGGSTTLAVDPNGTGNNYVDLAVLQGNVGLLLNDLIANGNLLLA